MYCTLDVVSARILLAFRMLLWAKAMILLIYFMGGGGGGGGGGGFQRSPIPPRFVGMGTPLLHPLRGGGGHFIQSMAWPAEPTRQPKQLPG